MASFLEPNSVGGRKNMSVCSASNLPKYPRDTDPIHKISTAMRAVVIIATLAISPSVAVASDPGDRTFTPLGGGTIGGAAGVAANGNLAAALPLLLPSPRG